MITIKEIYPPRKVSGLTSLLVSFPYSPDLVNAIKTMPLAVYHKIDYTWEIPTVDLAKLLDTLTFCDDITLELNQDNVLQQRLMTKQLIKGTAPSAHDSTALLTKAEVDNFKCAPLAHQLEAINFGLLNQRFLLLDEMGLGKTAEVIYLAEILKHRGLIDHCLIICGVNALKTNWCREIQKFSHESYRILGERITKRGTRTIGSIKARVEQLKNPIEEFFVITNIETLRSDDVIKELTAKKPVNNFGMIAVDEIHKAANKNSSQGGHLLKLTAPYLVGVTGTLLTASPVSAYLPLAWTKNDSATLTTFRAQYCEYGGFNNREIIGYKNLDALTEELDVNSLRRTTAQVAPNLPPLTLATEYLEMTEDHRKFYEEIKRGVKDSVDKVELTASNLLALTTRLRQAAVCPSILTSQPITSVKLQRAAERAEELVSIGEKVVIMSTFKEPVYQLAEELKAHAPLICTGDVDDRLISANVEAFLSDPTSKILIGTHDKMGTGFSLNSASYMVCLDQPWTWAQFDQTCKRLHRINNVRPAFVTTLLCEDSIDERVLEIIETKKSTSDAVLEGTTTQVSDNFTEILYNILKTC